MTARPHVVVTNRCFEDTEDLLSEACRVTVNRQEEPWCHDEVIDRCREADAVMVFMTDLVDQRFLDECRHLKIIGAALKGYDNIDVEAATHAGVWVTIVPDLLTVPTAELAIGLTIALSRKILVGDHRIRDDGFHGWRPSLYGMGLAGRTVGIVGFGAVGRAIAGRLGGFGAKLLACDTAEVPPPQAATAEVEIVPLAELVREADFVILAMPLTPATTMMFDAGLIACMKPGAYLVNPARGSLVDEAAVADALGSGHLAGYAADVFACEDWARPERPSGIDPGLLATRAATVLTPHLGSAVSDVRKLIERSAAESILEALTGRRPRHAINSPRAATAR